jgi:hypothetical protein
MKAREVRARLQGKCDPEIIFCLEAIAENSSAQAQEIMAMAQMLNDLTDILMQLGAVTEQATNAVDELKKIREG